MRSIRLGPGLSPRPPFTPPSISGCKLWLRADRGITLVSGNVSAWADQSGNGNNVSQATAGLRPPYVASDSNFNGRPSLTFSGVLGTYLAASGFSISQPDTIVLVGLGNPLSPATGTPFFYDGSSSRQALFNATGAQWYAYAGASLISSSSTISPAIFSCIFNGASSAVRVNGVSTAGAAGANALIGLVLGADTAFAGNLVGSIVEVAIYNRALGTTELQTLERDLGHEYGIAVS